MENVKKVVISTYEDLKEWIAKAYAEGWINTPRGQQLLQAQRDYLTLAQMQLKYAKAEVVQKVTRSTILLGKKARS